MNLVIVESPTKARTISKFLGREYKIESSYGHIRDLPKSKIGIDTEHNFEPQYVIPTRARKNVNSLKKLAAKSEKVILATDEDREGEAIAWHLTKALNIENAESPAVERIVFHEITESAIKQALKTPRGIDTDKVNAQQARRVLDRLVGYLLSPFLWKKVIRGLSAGRVQSVALRLIVEREQEIRVFKPEVYYTISAIFEKPEADQKFEALLSKINGAALPKPGIKTKQEAEEIEKDLKKSEFKVLTVETKEIKKNPLPPFITSTLQQEANKRLRFSVKQTMRLAQNLYENGFITYMRTDSVNLSRESLTAVHKWIAKELGKNYSLAAPRFFKTKSRLAQEAHEAIRPTRPDFVPQNLGGQAVFEDGNQERLYELIWRRFVASQLPQAIFGSTKIEIAAETKKNNYLLTANGSILRFDGFLKVWPQQFVEKELPKLQENEGLNLLEVKNTEHFTEPPPRYNEASLIKTLEEYGIGRPSTYAPIISVIQERNYVQKNEDRRFAPTEIGEIVNKVLTEHFPEIVDIQFTTHMEEDLDEIADGKIKWQEVVREFYEPFSKHLEQKYEEVLKSDLIKDEKTAEVCEKCGKPMVIKIGRFGRFLACSGFPDCKNTKSLNNGFNGQKQNFGPCPKCGLGQIVRKKTKKWRFFYGCNRYPECDFASWKKPENKSEENQS